MIHLLARFGGGEMGRIELVAPVSIETCAQFRPGALPDPDGSCEVCGWLEDEHRGVTSSGGGPRPRPAS